MDVSPKILSTCSRWTRPCNAHAVQNSSLTLSVYGLLLRDSSNISDAVGKTLVSTRFSASVMQNSDDVVENWGENSWQRSSGTLLTRNDFSTCASLWASLRKTALARTSNEARMRSMAPDCVSP